MFSSDSLPPPKTILSAAASLAASALLVKTIATDLTPAALHDHLSSSLKNLLKSFSSQLTLTIHEFHGLTPNRLFLAANLYLPTAATISSPRRLVVQTLHDDDDHLAVSVDNHQRISDVFHNITCNWILILNPQPVKISPAGDGPGTATGTLITRFFELRFHKKHKQTIFTKYLPYILQKAKQIEDSRKTVRLHTVDYSGTDYWTSVVLNHPATFTTMALDLDKKTELLEDIERFIGRRDYYRRVGKAWKRGYLFYGPPGTGKSSLVAAMANHLKFDVYDLDLREVQCNSDLRRLLIGTKNRSILVIEDIDRNVGLQSAREFDNEAGVGEEDKVTLSGLLNFIDGLWSSCGDERIIVFTTNHKERLDPALMRPGRMDVHLEMSYCTYSAFKTLATTYLQVNEQEEEELPFFGVIEELLKKVQVTPAEIAGELLKSDDSEIALVNLIHWLQTKEIEQGKVQD